MDTLQAIYFGQRHKDFDYKDYELTQQVKRLAKKHQRQCENSCNGYGIVKGQRYYGGQIDDYAKREYGFDVKSAYKDNPEYNIFDIEIDKIEEKINKLVYQFNMDKYALWKVKPLTIKYQRDPRGLTVKVFYEDDFIVL